jgi:hypothetical protein
MRTGLVLGYKSLDVDVARSSSCFSNPQSAPRHRLTFGIIALESRYPLHLWIHFFCYYRGGSLFLSLIVGYTAASLYLLQLATALQLFWASRFPFFFFHRFVVSICTGISCSMHSKFRSMFKDPILCSQSKHMSAIRRSFRGRFFAFAITLYISY